VLKIMAKKKDEQQGDGKNKYEQEPDFSDPEGFVDDISDERKLKILSAIAYL